VELVEIDHVDGEATEAVFDFTTDRIGPQRYPYIAVHVPAPAALSKNVGPRTGPAFESAGDDLFGVS
jgi:hypothetical protein